MRRTVTATALYLSMLLLLASSHGARAQQPRPQLLTTPDVHGLRNQVNSRGNLRAPRLGVRRRLPSSSNGPANTIEFEADGVILELQRTKAQIRGVGNVTWRGESPRQIELSGTDRRQRRSVRPRRSRRDAYLIEPSATGYSIKRENPAFAGSLADDVRLAPESGSQPPVVHAESADGTQIDLLILYTSQLYSRLHPPLAAMKIPHYVRCGEQCRTRQRRQTPSSAGRRRSIRRHGAARRRGVCETPWIPYQDAGIAALRDQPKRGHGLAPAGCSRKIPPAAAAGSCTERQLLV